MRIGPGEGAVQTNSMGRHMRDTPSVPDVHSEYVSTRVLWRWAAVLFCTAFWAGIVWTLLKFIA